MMNILAIGAHPDDIELGCGGLLLKASRQDHHNVFMYTLTRGGASGARPDATRSGPGGTGRARGRGAPSTPAAPSEAPPRSHARPRRRSQAVR